LAQQQGVSLVVGIAVGVNLVLLLQMSEDIHDKLSETLTGSIIGIAAIVSIVIVGVTIVYMQKRWTGGLEHSLSNKMKELKMEIIKTRK
jgi:predicted transporter